uniref:Uncharacterized protein n=1 Tax=Chromera velia CCMP2878 TaxID=1169474 RepID=A0A0G4F562_9ALVE|eukprot:Cvel_15198.t1-p1 / transcript=Cvel_15198.t1 / gene=Cvel_15198 / organism=Chromera_velia_CCMP2878 / gene_product=hypothetical protein / transcript_product=hypothetical protein / location=Cvel_scaffold1111:25171-34083(-) / protein_length=1391 / sequence_SO=supercontig / SO=protein_coding / is_pseudo=false
MCLCSSLCALSIARGHQQALSVDCGGDIPWVPRRMLPTDQAKAEHYAIYGIPLDPLPWPPLPDGSRQRQDFGPGTYLFDSLTYTVAKAAALPTRFPAFICYEMPTEALQTLEVANLQPSSGRLHACLQQFVVESRRAATETKYTDPRRLNWPRVDGIRRSDVIRGPLVRSATGAAAASGQDSKANSKKAMAYVVFSSSGHQYCFLSGRVVELLSAHRVGFVSLQAADEAESQPTRLSPPVTPIEGMSAADRWASLVNRDALSHGGQRDREREAMSPLSGNGGGSPLAATATSRVDVPPLKNPAREGAPPPAPAAGGGAGEIPPPLQVARAASVTAATDFEASGSSSGLATLMHHLRKQQQQSAEGTLTPTHQHAPVQQQKKQTEGITLQRAESEGVLSDGGVGVRTVEGVGTSLSSSQQQGQGGRTGTGMMMPCRRPQRTTSPLAFWHRVSTDGGMVPHTSGCWGRIGDLGTTRDSGCEGSLHLEEVFARPSTMRKDDIYTNLFTQEAQSPSDAFLNVYASPEGARVSMAGSKAEGVCRAAAECRAGGGRARAGCRAGAGCRARAECRVGAGCRARAAYRVRAGCRAGADVDATSTAWREGLGKTGHQSGASTGSAAPTGDGQKSATGGRECDVMEARCSPVFLRRKEGTLAGLVGDLGSLRDRGLDSGCEGARMGRRSTWEATPLHGNGEDSASQRGGVCTGSKIQGKAGADDGNLRVVRNPRGAGPHGRPGGGGPGRGLFGGAGGGRRGVETARPPRGLEQLRGGRDGCDANRASKLQNTQFRDVVRGGEPFEEPRHGGADTDVAAEWALSNKTKNRLAHAYHGNTSASPWKNLYEGFRQWLIESGGSEEEFNKLSLEKRLNLRKQFDDSEADDGQDRKRRRSALSALSSDALLPIDDKEIKPLLADIDRCEFLPRDWIEQTSLVIRRQKERCDDRDGMVQPLAVVRFSRGGKTRALKELAIMLGNTIFVSFNGKDHTDLSMAEEEDVLLHSQVSLLDCLLIRVAWALLPAQRKVAQNFAAWRSQHTVSRKLIQDHLSGKDCVLLVDELNALLGLANMLEKRVPEVQYRAQQLPLLKVTEWEDAKHLGVTARGEAAYFGRSPGLLVSSLREQTEPVRFVRNAEGVPKDPAGWRTWLEQLIKVTLEGTRPTDGLLMGWWKFFDLDHNDKLSIAPVFLSEMLKQCEGARVNGDDVHALALTLDRLRSVDEGDGKAWEAVVAVALGLRLLGLSVGVEWERLQPCPDIKSLAPGDLESFGGVIRLHGEAFSAEELKAAMRRRLEKGLSTLNGRIGFLVLPVSARFAKYDLFVCACTPGLKNIETWGYQCKEGGENPPLKSFPMEVHHGVWLRGKQKNQTQHDTWIVPPEDQIADLLGHSLASAAPFNWFHLSS